MLSMRSIQRCIHCSRHIYNTTATIKPYLTHYRSSFLPNEPHLTLSTSSTNTSIHKQHPHNKNSNNKSRYQSDVDISKLRHLIDSSFTDSDQSQFIPSIINHHIDPNKLPTQFIQYYDMLSRQFNEKYNTFVLMLLGESYIGTLSESINQWLISYYINELPVLHSTGTHNIESYDIGWFNRIKMYFARKFVPFIVGYDPVEMQSGVEYAYQHVMNTILDSNNDNFNNNTLFDSEVLSVRVQDAIIQTQLLKQLYKSNISIHSTIQSSCPIDMHIEPARQYYQSMQRLDERTRLMQLTRLDRLPCVTALKRLNDMSQQFKSNAAQAHTPVDMKNMNESIQNTNQQFIIQFNELVDEYKTKYNINTTPSVDITKYTDTDYVCYIDFKFDVIDTITYTDMYGATKSYQQSNQRCIRFLAHYILWNDSIHYQIRRALSIGVSTNELITMFTRFKFFAELYSTPNNQSIDFESVIKLARNSSAVQWRIEDIIDTESLTWHQQLQQLHTILMTK